MNSNSLRNPAPSNGLKDWPALGRHASHSEPNRLPGPGIGQLMAPSHSNNVHQLMANPNASYPFFCGAFQNGWQQAYTEGMPMFINLQNDRGEKTTISGRHQSHNIMASLQVLNYYLTLGSCDPVYIENHIRKHRLNRSLIPMYPTKEELAKRFPTYFNKVNQLAEGPSQKYDDGSGLQEAHVKTITSSGAATADKVVPQNMYTSLTNSPSKGDQQDYSVRTDQQKSLLKEKLRVLRDTMFIEDFNNKWKFMGVILTDMDLNSRYQKLFNLNVRGRSRIFNVWNSTSTNDNSRIHGRRDHVQKGDELYFTLKKVKGDANTYVTPDGTMMPIIPSGDTTTFNFTGVTGDITLDSENTFWQLVPTRKTLTNINDDDKGLLLNSNVVFPRRVGNIKSYQKTSIEHNIHVGKVLNSISKRPEQYFTSKACREHTQMILLPMLEIAIRIGGQNW